MSRLWRLSLTVLLVVSVALGGLASGTPNQRPSSNDGPLNMYQATVSPAVARDLAAGGYDIAATERVENRVRVDLVLSPAERVRLERKGVDLRLWRGRGGMTARQLAVAQAQNGFNVWRSFDEPGGIRDELYQIAADNPGLTKLEVIGHSIQGREIIALKVTDRAQEVPDGSRPAALYVSTQHAREWISTEVNRRLLHFFIDQANAGNPNIGALLRERELWFVLVANPDGYQYTFDVERLWRKNLRDNDGDGQITNNDGVDPNRNFPEHWNYDEEGSSSQFSSQTYRGAAPGSEPETQAMIDLMNRVAFAFLVNYHSFGNLLLYPEGWQVKTPSADDPIYVALSGTDANPAVPGFDPGVGADLYITNGETTDYAHAEQGILSWTPELGEGIPGSGFVFPDDEALVQAEFLNIRPFSLNVARSAADPDDPVSSSGVNTRGLYVDVTELDPEKNGNPFSDMTFDVSYGDPQPVQVLAKRDLGEVTLHYRINRGSEQTAPTSEWNGGERFGDQANVYYHFMRGEVTGTEPGDSVEVWFTGGGERSRRFEYTAAVESDAEVLIFSAEDYTGISPVQAPGPHYLSYFTSALEANGIGYEVYDVDAHGRQAPSALGVLSHFDAAIWYTGDDIITRDPGMVPGTASRVANDELLHVRSYMNEGGKLFYNGKFAGLQYSANAYLFDPVNNAPCPNPNCDFLQDDFLQYYLGAYIYLDDAGTDETGNPFDVTGVDTPFEGLEWSLNGADSANNQDHTASFLATSGLLPPDQYPQFLSWPSAKWDRPGGPFDPHTGEHYMYSQISDVSYKRLTRTFDLSQTDESTLSFWTSYDSEPEWDFVIVEARTADGDDWTTLPTAHTTQDTGESCSAGWHELHPFLEHYQTLNADGTCSPTGSTGEWNGASGNSGGWQQWEVDLSGFGDDAQVEVNISYVSDWSVQGLGVFVDDIVGPGGQGTTSFEEDGDPLDGWTVPGAPEGSATNANDWVRSTAAGFPEGAAITTEDSIYFGFGFEGITGADLRAAVMDRAVEYLLGP